MKEEVNGHESMKSHLLTTKDTQYILMSTEEIMSADHLVDLSKIITLENWLLQAKLKTMNSFTDSMRNTSVDLNTEEVFGTYHLMT